MDAQQNSNLSLIVDEIDRRKRNHAEISEAAVKTETKESSSQSVQSIPVFDVSSGEDSDGNGGDGGGYANGQLVIKKMKMVCDPNDIDKTRMVACDDDEEVSDDKQANQGRPNNEVADPKVEDEEQEVVLVDECGGEEEEDEAEDDDDVIITNGFPSFDNQIMGEDEEFDDLSIHRRKSLQLEMTAAACRRVLPSPPEDLSAWDRQKWMDYYAVDVDTTVGEMFRRINAYARQHCDTFNEFNRSIWSHMMKNLQDDWTFTWKMRVRRLLHDTFLKYYPNCHLIAVGSTINGCGSYNSDMDLCLCIEKSGNGRGRGFALKCLMKMKRVLREMPPVAHVECIHAKVPILKIAFTHPYQTLQVDINVNNVPGIYNSFLLHYYSRIDDRFPAICLVVKHWAKKAGIGEAFNGTFNSYSLILMVLHYLQVAADPPILPNLQVLYPDFFAASQPLADMNLFGELPHPLPKVPENNKTVGELLIGFFKYFSDFDFENYAISIARGCVFHRSELPQNTRRFKVFIEEPFDYQNTARCITSLENWACICRAFFRARDAFLARNAWPPTLDALIRF